MSTALAPVQTDRAAWEGSRLGLFTASVFGKLMTQPISKADREAGKLSKTALAVIEEKALERLTGQTSHNPTTPSMRRGILLEPVARHILSKVWTPIAETPLAIPDGAQYGATPDGLLFGGNATMDLKCPEDSFDVVRFGAEVADDDWAALEAWDKNYAWQVMVQAKACGVTDCWLVYFTDRLDIFKLDDLGTVSVPTEAGLPLVFTQRQWIQVEILDRLAEFSTAENEYPWRYSYATDGFFYVARRFTLTPERSALIDATVERAVMARSEAEERMRPILFPQQVQHEQEIERAIATILDRPKLSERARLQLMIDHLADMPYPVDMDSPIGQLTVNKAKERVRDIVHMLETAIHKDIAA